ncbi:hypothetical protein GCM10017786_08320 [Amycolatopsis deserti]|uniref:SnoaL-like domain-containing protein n=1 Tax=Amycolatopsis deserti TaxID=185696 RepID=A0ABQ3IDR3_9PSEU|nr:nuclear transport factor 2 family protein [Amycolatopsis deserti]GHE80514.1 hypothetical protein GCM10017786_08320 [Amycolatopsis deserti]
MQTSTEVAVEYLRRFASRDFAGALALTADDATYRSADGAEHGKEATAQLYGMLATLFTDLRVDVLGTTAEGARVAVEAVVEGSLTNGGHYRNSVHYLFVVDGGRITSTREYCDTKPAEAFFQAAQG